MTHQCRMGWPAALNCIPLETRKAHVTPNRSTRNSDDAFESQDWTHVGMHTVQQAINGAAERRPCGPQNTARNEKPAAPPSTTDKPQGVWVKTSERKPPKAGIYTVSTASGDQAREWSGLEWRYTKSPGTDIHQGWEWLDTSTPAIGEAGAPQPVADAGGWIKHDGKGMPVEGATKVEVHFRDGDHDSEMTAAYWHEDDPKDSNWVHSGGDEDIIAYRVLP